MWRPLKVMMESLWLPGIDRRGPKSLLTNRRIPAAEHRRNSARCAGTCAHAHIYSGSPPFLTSPNLFYSSNKAGNHLVCTHSQRWYNMQAISVPQMQNTSRCMAAGNSSAIFCTSDRQLATTYVYIYDLCLQREGWRAGVTRTVINTEAYQCRLMSHILFFQREKQPHTGTVFCIQIQPHQIIMCSKNIKPTQTALQIKNKVFGCFVNSSVIDNSDNWTYIVARRGLSWWQGSRAEDRGAGWTAELGKRVRDGRKRRCPQLLLLLL